MKAADLEKLTTHQDYDRDFETVKTELGIGGAFESEAEKSAGDAINNTWVEGITLAAWINSVRLHPWYSAADLCAENNPGEGE